MSKKTVRTTASGLAQFTGMKNLSPLDTEEVTELGQYFNKSGGGGGGFEPTEAQLEAMNSGITSTKVATYDTLPNEDDVKDIISDHFVAGTNVTITDNADGTQTIASTASGGTSDYSDLTNKPTINNVTLSGNKTTSDLGISEVPTITSSDDGKFLKAYYDSSDADYEWADLDVNQVPNVTSNDNGKVLTATHSGGVGTYAWGTIPSELPPYTTTLADLGKVLTINLSSASGLGWEKPLPTYTPSDYGKVLTVTLDQTSAPIISWEAPSTPTPPTAYTMPTLDTTYVTNPGTWTKGGYVVVNNICYINLSLQLKSAATSTTSCVVATGFPKPLGGSFDYDAVTRNTNPGWFSLDSNGALTYKHGSSTDTSDPRMLCATYLIDTST